jgi:hypothetical protein
MAPADGGDLHGLPDHAQERSVLAGALGGHSTQVVSQGRYHHSRFTEELQPWSSGLKAPAGFRLEQRRRGVGGICARRYIPAGAMLRSRCSPEQLTSSLAAARRR